MRTLFRYLLDERGWEDYAAFLPHFREAARKLSEAEGNPSIATLEPASKTFEAWYYGQRRPQRDARRVLIRLFNLSIDRLWSPVLDGTTPDTTPLVGTQSTAQTDDKRLSLHEMMRTAAMAAQRAASFAMGAERGPVGEETLGLLTDKVQSIVQDYPRVPLSHVWEEILQVQDEVFCLLESGRARPSQMRELNVLATIITFHMAKGTHDMGDAKGAMMQARAAGVCAKNAEHDSLVALVYGLKSLITYWGADHRPARALHYARQGLAECPNLRGTVGIWLSSLEARAAAMLGDEEAVRTANQRAADLREAVRLDELDGLGGLLTFPETKQLYYAAESEVLLRHGDSRVAALAEEAVRGFSDRSASHWAFGDEAGARCNLALVHLYGGEVDGAAEAIRPVLDLAPPLRNRGIVVSAERVHSALSNGPAEDSVTARELREEIEAYSPNRLALPR